MKHRIALTAAGITALVPTIAVASQPGQPPAGQSSVQVPADQSSTQTQGAVNPQDLVAKPKGAMPSSCVTGKSVSAETRPSSPSAKVGKDTGDLPPPRKKVSKDSVCTTQPE